MIKITGNLPHPTKKGFLVSNPFLFITPTINRNGIDLLIEAYLTKEDLENGNKIGGENYKFRPIPYFVWRCKNKETFEVIICHSVATITEHQTINNELQEVKVLQGHTMNGQTIVLAKNDNYFFETTKVDIRPSDNESTNVVDKLLRYCHEVIISEMSIVHKDLVESNQLSFEIIL